MFHGLLDFHLYCKFILFVIVSSAIVRILTAARTHCSTVAQNCALHMVCVSAQLDIDFATICQEHGYPPCSNKLFELWPIISKKLIAAKPQATGILHSHDMHNISVFTYF